MRWWQVIILIPLMITLNFFVSQSLGYFLQMPGWFSNFILLILFIPQYFILKDNFFSQKLLKHPVEQAEIEKLLANAVSANFKIEVRAFRDKLLHSDKIWYWESPEESWRSMRGCAGYVIVRQGKATRHYIITKMN